MYEGGASVEELDEKKREAIEKSAQAVRRDEMEGKPPPDPRSVSELGESNESMWDEELGGEG